MSYRNACMFGAAILGVASLSTAQNVRTSTELSPSAAAYFDLQTASEGDLSIIAYVADGQVLVHTSDAAGKTWSAPVRLDSDASLARKDMSYGAIAIADGVVHVMWEDRRDQGGTADPRELYLATSFDGGATWTTEQRLDFGFTLGLSEGRDDGFRIDAAPGGILYASHSADPDGASNEEYVLIQSTDFGATFGTPIVVPQGYAAGAFDPDAVATVADASGNLYLAFADNRNGTDDLFLQKFDFATSSLFAADLQLSVSGGDIEGGLNGVAVAVDGMNVAVSYLTEPTGAGDEACRVVVSTDGGATFSAPVTVSGGDVDFTTVGFNGGNVVVAWDDNINGGADELFVATSSDNGLTFSAPTNLGFSSAANFSNGALGFVSGAFPEGVSVAISDDAGATWTTTVASTTIGDADFGRVAFNTTTNNAIAGWFADDSGSNLPYAGGFRPQTVTANGWDDVYNPATTMLNFDVSGFGDDAIVFVVLSASEGPSPVGPQSICLGADFVGLFGDPLFTAVPLMSGAGATPAVPNIFAGGVPFGVTLYYAGIGASGAGSLGRVSDNGSFVL